VKVGGYAEWRLRMKHRILQNLESDHWISIVECHLCTKWMGFSRTDDTLILDQS
jgi:hypothetical protein